jgi:hypothetical protein
MVKKSLSVSPCCPVHWLEKGCEALRNWNVEIVVSKFLGMVNILTE